MDTHHCIKILTFSLPLLCLLLSWSYGGAASTTTPPPSSALIAAEILKTRGYSHFASILLSLSTATTNFSGTILAPPDFAFSFATAKFFNHHRSPPRPSISLLLYHTLKPPLVLTWPSLSSRDDGNELRTLYYNKCLFVFKNPFGGEITISSSPFRNPISAVKIRQPDLYVDEHLTIHGIDGVLDPNFATKCSNFPNYVDPTAELAPIDRDRTINRSFLDHAMRGLRRKGFNVVAAAMGINRSDLLSLTSVTVFAVSDKSFFLKSDGFAYDFRHHVVPMRHRFRDLVKLAVGETEFDTLASNKTVFVDSVDGAVRVNGVAVDGTEVYHNRWISVVAIAASFNDVVCLPVSDYAAPSPAPANFHGGESDFNSIGAPSPAPDLAGVISDYSPDDFVNSGGEPSPAPATEAAHDSFIPPTPVTEGDDVSDTHCDLNDVVSIGAEGGDLFCPGNKARELREMTDVHVEDSKPLDADGPAPDDTSDKVKIAEKTDDVHVEETKPLDADGQAPDDLTESDKVKIAENVNIADDLFFYI